jgi:hypothetical protein
MLPPSSWTWVIAIPLLGYSLIWLYRSIALLRNIRIYNLPWAQNEYEILSYDDCPIFIAAGTLVRQLEDRGFEPLGVLPVRLFWQNIRGEEWIYINAHRTVADH